jgi:TonB-linked SusC/RagA family outer membrane protein
MKKLFRLVRSPYPLCKDNLKMKLSTLFLLATIFTTQANDTYGQRTKITLNLNGVSVGQLIDEIESSTEFEFVYKLNDVNLMRKVSVTVKEETITTVLDQVFKNTKTTYSLNEKRVYLVREKEKSTKIEVLAFIPTPIIQQSISGIITDTNGQPLPGASIVEKGTTNGVTTDFDGNFSIDLMDDDAILLISFIGFVNKEIPVLGQNSITIELEEDTASLEEVVVIGYGSVKKSDLTGSVSSIQADKLNTDSQASVEQIIQGRLAGVQVTQSSAEPGGAFSIRVRGTNSISAGNEPLYVIDGLAGANPGNSLNPSDVKSIEVLKDASATAIYGARGSNGVVLITTKQGQKNSALEISYNVSTSFQTAARTLDMMDAQEYMLFYNDVYADRGLEPLFGDNDFSALGAGTNWQNEIFRTAPIYEHRLSFSGGSEDTQYYVSLNAFDQEGIVINSGFERWAGRVNLTHSVGDKLKIGINLNTSFENENRVPLGLGVNATSGVIATALQLPPTDQVFNNDGSYGTSLQDLSNSVAQAETIDEFEKTTRIFGNGFVEYEFIKDLKAKANFGFDQRIARRNTFFDLETQIGQLNQGRATQTLIEDNNYLFELTLDYNKVFADKHKLNLLAGYSYQEFTNSGFNASAQEFPTTAFGPNNLGAGNPLQYEVGSTRGENTLISGFGRVNYSYDNRYILTGSFRADGSSRFGENNKVAYFPSGAVAWNINNESFFPEDAFVSNLKLRASYGLSGNQEIANGQSLTLLESGPIAVLDGLELQTIAPAQLPNPNLQWETTESFNLGIDFGFLSNRISGTMEYFNNNTRDLLLFLPVPTTTGFNQSLQNVGDTRNSGFEFSIASRNLVGEFSWTTDFNIATLQNEVTNLGELPRILQGGTRFVNDFTLLEVGSPVNSYNGFVFDGVFQSEEEVANAPTQNNAAAGGRRFQDINGDNVIDDEDRVILGDPFPDFTFGLNNTFSYKGFNLDVFIEGKSGFELANFTTIDSENPIDDLRNRQTYALDRWTPQNQTNEQPSFVNPSRAYDFNSRVVEDASFVRLRSARISYSFPNLKLRNISSLMVYASGQNLATWTDYSGFNPDLNSLGNSNVRIDYSAYPLARIFSIGLNVNF